MSLLECGYRGIGIETCGKSKGIEFNLKLRNMISFTTRYVLDNLD